MKSQSIFFIFLVFFSCNVYGIERFPKELQLPISTEQSKAHAEFQARLEVEGQILQMMTQFFSEDPEVRFWKFDESQLSALLFGVANLYLVESPLFLEANEEENKQRVIRLKMEGSVHPPLLQQRIQEIVEQPELLQAFLEYQENRKTLGEKVAQLQDSSSGQLNELQYQMTALDIQLQKAKGKLLENTLKKQGEERQTRLQRLEENQNRYDQLLLFFQEEIQKLERLQAVTKEDEEGGESEKLTLQDRKSRYQLFLQEEITYWQDIKEKRTLQQVGWDQDLDSKEIEQIREEIEKLEKETTAWNTILKRHHLLSSKKLTYLLKKTLGPGEIHRAFQNTDFMGITNADELGLEEKIAAVNKVFQIQNLKRKYLFLAPYIDRLEQLQKQEIAQKQEKIQVILGNPDPEIQRFPITFEYRDPSDFETKRWTRYWYYDDIEKAREIYNSQEKLVALGQFQLEEKKVIKKSKMGNCMRPYKAAAAAVEIWNTNSLDATTDRSYQQGDQFCVLEQQGSWMKTQDGWIKEQCPQFYRVLKKELSIHTEPNEFAKSKGFYPAGHQVCGLKEQKGWLQVDKGWLKKECLLHYQVRTPRLRIYSKSSSSSRTVARYPENELVCVLERKEGWLHTDKGWIEEKCPNPYQVTVAELEIRSKRSAKASPFGKYTLGNQVCVLEKKDYWLRTKRGWVREECPQHYLVSTQLLNIRRSWSSTSEILGRYERGSLVCVIDERITDKKKNQKWLRTTEGWVYGGLLEKIPRSQLEFPKYIEQIPPEYISSLNYAVEVPQSQVPVAEYLTKIASKEAKAEKYVERVARQPDRIVYEAAPALTKLKVYHLPSQQSQEFDLQGVEPLAERKRWKQIKDSMWKLFPSIWTNPWGMELVRLSPGRFYMGSGKGFYDELPMHPVSLSKGFYLQNAEVTLELYRQYKPEHQNLGPCQQGDCPVNGVSWGDVQQFIQWLNQNRSQAETGIYRLPTESEWEYAARAGNRYEYSVTAALEEIPNFAWFDGNSESQAHPIKQKSPNAWGLFDMQGNVQEWVSDWYGEYPIEALAVHENPQGPATGVGKVIRGGSWGHVVDALRVASRDYASPSTRYQNTGFRVVYELKE